MRFSQRELCLSSLIYYYLTAKTTEMRLSVNAALQRDTKINTGEKSLIHGVENHMSPTYP